MSDIGLAAAFAAGVLALLSPCSALLLPSFFAYAFGNPIALLRRTSVFALGLMITLVPLGTGAGAVSSLFYGHRGTLILVAGWLIIALGVLQILGAGLLTPLNNALQNSVGAWGRARQQRGSYVGTLALGAVYGLAGFCSGPALGAILTMAATSDSPAEGGLLLAIYALGMAAPLFFLALLWDRFNLAKRSWVRGRMLSLGPLQVHSTALISGVLFIVIGALFLIYDGTAGLLGGGSAWTEVEFAAQEWVLDTLGNVPSWAVVAAISAVALLAAWRRTLRGRRGSAESTNKDRKSHLHRN